MRVRSYPSFTRVVLETSAPVIHKLDGVDGGALRVRLLGLAGRARAEDVADGFVDTVKLGRAGNDSVLTVSFGGAAGELKARRRVGDAFVDRAYEMPEPVSELAAALAKLSPKQRAAALLHFRDNYTLAEVAEIIGSTTAAVGVHLYRARRRLRELLGDDDD